MSSTSTDRINGVTTSVAIKAPCKAVSTSTLTLNGEQTVGGVACVTGDRVLYAKTGGSVDNGIWIVSTGDWTRAPDFDGNRDVVSGTMVLAPSGNPISPFYRVTNANPIVIGETAIAFQAYDNDANDLAAALEAYTETLKLLRVEAGGGTGTANTASSFLSTREITTHAWYSFLANDIVDYAGGAPVYGRAAFNDNSSITGGVPSDHYHCFQAYPHWDNSATVDRLSGFWMQPDITDGTVLELSQFRANDPTGTPDLINNLYGFYCDELTKGAGNYAFFAEGESHSHLGDSFSLGAIETPALIAYDRDTGHLEFTPRTGYKLFARGPMVFGTASTVEADSAKVEYDSNTGHLLITPRSTFRAKVVGTFETTGPAVLPAYTVATLPAAASYTYGRAFVTDANATTFNSTVAGGGANKVPVWSDGATWRIG